MTEGRFERVGWKRWCAQSANCDPQVDVGACVEVLRSTDRQGCVYDPEMATACYDDLANVLCRDVDVGVQAIDSPTSCQAVWICEDSP